MKVAIGCDHHGVGLKDQLIQQMTASGHEVIDAGVNDDQPVDYPDIAAAVAGNVSAGTADRGVLICGSGIGMAMAANKLPGVRAAVCCDEKSAEMSRRHNDANVVCLSADTRDATTNEQIVNTWLITDFDGGRHSRRVQKIRDLEQRP